MLYVDKNKVKQKVSKLVINTISNLMTYASEMKPSRIQKDLEANFWRQTETVNQQLLSQLQRVDKEQDGVTWNLYAW